MKASKHAHERMAALYKELTDPEILLENKKKRERKEIIEERKSDTGFEEY